MRTLLVAASAAVTFIALYGCKPGAKTQSVAPLYDSAPVEHRNIEVTEVAKTAVYLASDLSSGVTGETIYVDCGYNIMGF